MINPKNISNVTIVADMNRLLSHELINYFNRFEDFCKEINLNDPKAEDLMPAIFLKDAVTKKTLQIALNTAFYLEAVINTYAEETKNFGRKSTIENFFKLSTTTKWEELFPDYEELNERIKDLFSFRDYIVHSKPNIADTDGYKAFSYKEKKWVKPEEISSLLKGNTTGLIQEGFSVEDLKKVLEITNLSVEAFRQETPSFLRHYKYELEVDYIVEQYSVFLQRYDSESKKLARPDILGTD